MVLAVVDFGGEEEVEVEEMVAELNGKGIIG